MPEDNNPGLPEIPSFRSGQQEQEKKASGLPLSGQNPTPQNALRLRGSSAATSVIERLKQLKKKDLIFIASGLSVLFTAPLAEHFMLGPGGESNVLRQGFDNKGTPFTEANPYEPGTGGFAPGGLPGQSSEVITPLNVRDPANLVLSPGAAQQPPVGGAGGGGEGKQPEESWKNAIGEAARKGVGGPSESAGAGGLPVAKGALAGALRGLSALAGATSAGMNAALPPISANNVPNRGGGGGNLVSVKPIPNYSGVASHGLGQGSSIDALKAAAEKQGSLLNAGSAANGLQNAAQAAIPTSGGQFTGAGGGPGNGASNQNPSGNSSKNSSTLGESIAALIAKQRAEKELELEFKKRDWLEFERAKAIQESIIKAVVDGFIAKPIGEVGSKISDNIIDPMFGDSGKIECANFGIPQPDGTSINRSKYFSPVGSRSIQYSIQKWNKFTGSANTKDNPGGAYTDTLEHWFEESKHSEVTGVQCWNTNGGGAPDNKGKDVSKAPSGFDVPADRITDEAKQICKGSSDPLCAEYTSNADKLAAIRRDLDSIKKDLDDGGAQLSNFMSEYAGLQGVVSASDNSLQRTILSDDVIARTVQAGNHLPPENKDLQRSREFTSVISDLMQGMEIRLTRLNNVQWVQIRQKVADDLNAVAGLQKAIDGEEEQLHAAKRLKSQKGAAVGVGAETQKIKGSLDLLKDRLAKMEQVKDDSIRLWGTAKGEADRVAAIHNGEPFKSVLGNVGASGTGATGEDLKKKAGDLLSAVHAESNKITNELASPLFDGTNGLVVRLSAVVPATPQAAGTGSHPPQ